MYPPRRYKSRKKAKNSLNGGVMSICENSGEILTFVLQIPYSVSGICLPHSLQEIHSPEAFSFGGSLREDTPRTPPPGGSPYLTPKNSPQPLRREISPRDTGSPGGVFLTVEKSLSWRLQDSRSPRIARYDFVAQILRADPGR